MTAEERCTVCGETVAVRLPADWHPTKIRLWASWRLEEHLSGHDPLERERAILRASLEQLDPEVRRARVAAVYRALLLKDGHPSTVDGDGRYSLDDVLGLAALRAAWHSTLACGLPGHRHR